MNRAVAPWNPCGQLHCDEFRRDASYTNWRPNNSGDWLLIYTKVGAGRFVSSDGVPLATQPGDAVLYAPHEFQDYSTCPEAGRWHLVWAHFLPKPHWQSWLAWPRAENGLKVLRLGQSKVHEDFRTAVQRMIEIYKRPVPLAWLAASRDQWVTMDGRVRQAVDFLSARYREPFLLEKLARHCGLSVSRLAHLFKEQTGLSPQRYLEEHRMLTASRLLRLTGLTITEVAAEVGYDDPFYFSNRFRRYSGKSPNRFRAHKSV
jgi:AraC family transcriptional regulator of arabinose operon